ncbi:MAG TPA: flagellar hook protein FlgE [Sphingomonadaceae bacterium]|nr:flagellar hook protein FlgE [Sphingomonadaceae bacterium]
MSLYSALYAGVSGLAAQSSAMATVADNITNVNTVGYKNVQADFSTLVSGSGQGSGDYSAGGVSAVSKSLISKNGLLQAASSNSDLAIDGNGFFVVRDGTGADSKIAYTRAGSFSPDKQGNLFNTAGYYLQGWPLDASGKFVNNGNLNELQTVNINSLSGTAQPTSKVALRVNLQSTTEPIANAASYAAGDIANGTVAPQFSRSVDVYDAQGNAHHLTFGFVKTATNTWKAEVYVNPKTDVTTPGNDGVLASGTVKFNPDGSLDLAGSDAGLFADITPAWTNGAGASPIKLALGTDGGLDGLTQSSDQSALLASSADGGLLGAVTDVNISESGIVSAVFENGTMRAIYQLPLATFANPDGLTAIQGNAYMASDDSGNALINPADTQGSGKIASRQLEASNADLATEFTNMIRFQRAYSASSKIVTTVDQMLQELNDMKR